MAYTALLACLGKISSRKIKDDNSFFSGGSSFGVVNIITCVSASTGSPVFIAVLELSYTNGISATWFGIANMLMLAFIGFVLVNKYKTAGLVTFSGILGKRYGDVVQTISSLIIGLSFPMFAIGGVIGASAILSVALGWPIWLSVFISSLIILIYVLVGGMYAIGLTQFVNLLVIYFGLILALVVSAINPGFGKLAHLPPEYKAAFTLGMDTVLVWCVTFFTNAVIAQSLIQMIMSCKNVKAGRMGTVIGIIGIIPMTIIPAVLGMVTVLVVPGFDNGLLAFAQYMIQFAPAPVSAIVFLGVWAAALSFAGPCLFSGGTSLGRDFIGAINPKATARQLMKYGRYATVLLTVLVIIYGFVRSEQAAWWNILGYNLRNSAIFAPTIAALVWPVASERATVFTMILGVSSGFLWYYLGDFSTDMFYMNIHPMWVGMSLNLLTLVIASLIEQRRKITIDWSVNNSRLGFFCLTLSLLGIILLLVYADVLKIKGLLGCVFFLITMGIYAASVIFLKKKEDVSDVKINKFKCH